MTAPDRTLAQRMDALGRGNHVRIYRADLKKDIKARRKDALKILADVPVEVETMKVMALLLAIPKIGRGKANKRLAQVRISPTKTIGGLTDRQRGELIAALGGTPVVRARNVKRKPVAPRLCDRCGDRTYKRSDIGICGWCRAELAELEAAGRVVAA